MSTMRAVYTNLRAARTAIQDMSRLRQIAAVLVRHGFGHIVEAWRLQDKAIVGLLVQGSHEATGNPLERVVLILEALGPTFVKLGQILSTRPDLIPQALCDELKSLQNDVAPLPEGVARGALFASLGQPIEDVFEAFDDAPLACASIAQVHTARLKTGEEVVVKIQRPNVKKTISSDLHILYFIARQMEAAIPEAGAFNPVAIVREFERAIVKELDFRFEANHLERFAQNFEAWERVRIPALYRAHCSETVLVMERFRGHKITEAPLSEHQTGLIAKDSVAMLFKMVFEDGLFHGDLHPGNLLILETGEIGLIDFGMVGRMTPLMQDRMADMILYIATRRYESVARVLHEIAVHRRKVDYTLWEQDVVDLLERHFAHGTLADVDFGVVFRDLVEGAVRHDASIPPDYTMFFKALMTIEGVGKAIAPELDLVAELRPHVERVVAARYKPDRVLKTLADTAHTLARLG
ncbi:phosphotransferase, partial [Myxococcota bacterium]|nr:phosphotransferase [Myxococcota bacterium]